MKGVNPAKAIETLDVWVAWLKKDSRSPASRHGRLVLRRRLVAQRLDRQSGRPT